MIHPLHVTLKASHTVCTEEIEFRFTAKKSNICPLPTKQASHPLTGYC